MAPCRGQQFVSGTVTPFVQDTLVAKIIDNRIANGIEQFNMRFSSFNLNANDLTLSGSGESVMFFNNITKGLQSLGDGDLYHNGDITGKADDGSQMYFHFTARRHGDQIYVKILDMTEGVEIFGESFAKIGRDAIFSDPSFSIHSSSYSREFSSQSPLEGSEFAFDFDYSDDRTGGSRRITTQARAGMTLFDIMRKGLGEAGIDYWIAGSEYGQYIEVNGEDDKKKGYGPQAKKDGVIFQDDDGTFLGPGNVIVNGPIDGISLVNERAVSDMGGPHSRANISDRKKNDFDLFSLFDKSADDGTNPGDGGMSPVGLAPRRSVGSRPMQTSDPLAAQNNPSKRNADAYGERYVGRFLSRSSGAQSAQGTSESNGSMREGMAAAQGERTSIPASHLRESSLSNLISNSSSEAIANAFTAMHVSNLRAVGNPTIVSSAVASSLAAAESALKTENIVGTGIGMSSPLSSVINTKEAVGTSQQQVSSAAIAQSESAKIAAQNDAAVSLASAQAAAKEEQAAVAHIISSIPEAAAQAKTVIRPIARQSSAKAIVKISEKKKVAVKAEAKTPQEQKSIDTALVGIEKIEEKKEVPTLVSSASVPIVAPVVMQVVAPTVSQTSAPVVSQAVVSAKPSAVLEAKKRQSASKMAKKQKRESKEKPEKQEKKSA